MAKCKPYLPAGAHFTGTAQGFQDLGVQIIRGTDVEMLKTLVSGAEEFAANFCDKRSKELDEAFEAAELHRPFKNPVSHQNSPQKTHWTAAPTL